MFKGTYEISTIKEEEKMNKLQQLKQAIKNPPPERLAAIEYKSHFMQGLGITAVCIILIAKGFWYIIFAFIFGVGISYSQGITAYTKYKMIMSMKSPEDLEVYHRIPSFTRRRGKIINHVYGNSMKIIVTIASVVLAMLIIPPTLSRWLLMIVYPSTIAVLFFLLYFFVIYWIANSYYKKDLKGGK